MCECQIARHVERKRSPWPISKFMLVCYFILLNLQSIDAHVMSFPCITNRCFVVLQLNWEL